MKPHFGQSDAKMNELAGIHQPSFNHENIAVSECEKCVKTFKTISPDLDCNKLRDKLQQKTEFCRICGEDALKEIEQLENKIERLNGSLSLASDDCTVLATAVLARKVLG